MSALKGPGRAVFTAILLLIGGVLNTIYGIAAISNSHFFNDHAHYVFGNLKTWGWVTLILGIIELLAGVSLFGGGTFGRWIGILAGSLVAIDALISIPAYPFWSLAIFALSLWIVHGLTRDEQENYANYQSLTPGSDLSTATRARPPA